jgi:cell division protein FtsX
MKRIIKITLLGVLTFTSFSTKIFAQDDVSIMDLKEGVYDQILDIEKMKNQQKVFLDKIKKESEVNKISIQNNKEEIEKLKKELHAEMQTDVLNDYGVSNDLKKLIEQEDNK